MRLLVIDSFGAALDFCMRAANSGHEVKWFIKPMKNGDRCAIGDGLVNKVDVWEKWAYEWADLVFLTDNTAYMDDLDRLRKTGVAVFGPSDRASDLELDRAEGQTFLKKCGVKTIPYREFSDYDKAISFVKSTGKRYVSKPSGDADKALSYLSKSAADMVFMLERWKSMGKNKAPFILQDFIPGVEVAVGGWYGPAGFIKDTWFENFENKKLMSGDMGPNTGEMGTLGKYVRESQLAEDLLLPCEKALASYDLTGYVDIATIMDEDGQLWPLEFTVRPGWPTFNLQTAVHEGDPVRWMYDLCRGASTLRVSEEHVTGILMAIPDFPYSSYTKKELSGFPVYNLDKVDSDSVHLCEVKLGRAPVMRGDKIVVEDVPVTAGDYVLVASGQGDSVRSATKRAYSVLDKIEMPNSPFYRNDIGDRLAKQLDEVQAHGYCLDWNY